MFLCFLALMLVRIAERKTGLTWDRIRGVMERLHLIEFFSKDGRVLQTTEPMPEQLKIMKQLKISLPKRIQSIQNNPEIHRHTTKKKA
ncbi:MAG: transposase [Deltaproteobacteria bacterium]|nr:transposase [Deltaproteobacteria bacterium]